MDHDLQLKADELIRTLGALGLVQECSPLSPDVASLTHDAQQLHDSLLSASPDR